MITLIACIVTFLILMILLRPFSYDSGDNQKKWSEKVIPMIEKMALTMGIVMATLCGLEVYFGIQIIEVRCQPPEYIHMLLSLVPFFVCGAITSGVVHSHVTGKNEAQEYIKSITSVNILSVLLAWCAYFLFAGNIAVATSIFTLLAGKFVWFDFSMKNLREQIRTLANTQGIRYTVIMMVAVFVCLYLADCWADLFSLLACGVIGGMVAAGITIRIIMLSSSKKKEA